MFNNQTNKDRGSVIVFIALMMTVLLGCSALVLDISMAYMQKAKLQNAVDASALAGAQELPDITSALNVANQYISSNGFSPSDINVSFLDDNNTISVTGNKTINYTFARILGFNSGTISVLAAASKGNIGDAFNYALFSGSSSATLTLNGSNQSITGSTHSNKNFDANGSKLNITGACEAVTTVTTNGSQISIGSIVQNAPFVNMPDFSTQIKTLSDSVGQSYTGNKNYNGSNIDVSSPIYIDGNLSVNGSHFSGKGTILATGSITFNGSNLYQNNNDSICFYSENGDITINGSNAILHGIVYAPRGTITLNGSNQTIYGRIIGQKISINGSNLNVISGKNDLKSLPSSGIKLIQ